MIKNILKIIGLIFIAPWVFGIFLLIGWCSLFVFVFLTERISFLRIF